MSVLKNSYFDFSDELVEIIGAVVFHSPCEWLVSSSLC